MSRFCQPNCSKEPVRSNESDFPSIQENTTCTIPNKRSVCYGISAIIRALCQIFRVCVREHSASSRTLVCENVQVHRSDHAEVTCALTRLAFKPSGLDRRSSAEINGRISLLSLIYIYISFCDFRSPGIDCRINAGIFHALFGFVYVCECVTIAPSC